MMTNADRAARAEAALAAYIEETGDSLRANEIDTWVGDLLCDLRHLAKAMGFEFNPDAGSHNFEAECDEEEQEAEETGEEPEVFIPVHDWLPAASPVKADEGKNGEG